MKYRILITPDALADIDDIFAYIAADNPRAAAKIVGGFRQDIRSLSRFPKRCPYAPEHGVLDMAEVRHLTRGHYRIIFGIEDKKVVVLAVRHDARLPLTKDET